VQLGPLTANDPETEDAMTATKARYERETQLVTTSRSGGLPVHYVMTRHGAVARTWMPGCTEVVLWRPRSQHPTYQGSVAHVGLAWVATDPHGTVVATASDYLDAEAALLPLRTGTRSRAGYAWPWEIRQELEWRRTPAASADCDVCGQPLQTGVCFRTDLHWGVVDGEFRTTRDMSALTR
jgi:hypothetical protein